MSPQGAVGVSGVRDRATRGDPPTPGYMYTSDMAEGFNREVLVIPSAFRPKRWHFALDIGRYAGIKTGDRDIGDRDIWDRDLWDRDIGDRDTDGDRDIGDRDMGIETYGIETWGIETWG